MSNMNVAPQVLYRWCETTQNFVPDEEHSSTNAQRRNPPMHIESSSRSVSHQSVNSEASSTSSMMQSNLLNDLELTSMNGSILGVRRHDQFAGVFDDSRRTEEEGNGVAEAGDGASVSMSTVHTNVVTPSFTRKGGKKRDPLWFHFSNIPDIPSRVEERCKHCMLWIKFSRHIETVRNHLRTCRPYLEWKRSYLRACLPIGFPLDLEPVPPITQKQGTITAIPMPTVAEIKTFQKKFAMHYYMTGKC